MLLVGKGESVTLGQWEQDIDRATGVLTISVADHDFSLIVYE